MGLLLQLLPVVAVFLFGAPAPGLAVPMAPLHDLSHLGHNAISVPAHPNPIPEGVESILEFLLVAWKVFIRVLETHRRHPRSTELASPVPDPPSPGAAPQDMSDDDLAAKVIVMVWEFIWRSNQDKFHNAEDGSPPQPPPTLDVSSLKHLLANRSPGAAPDSSIDYDSLAEAIKLVWEYMWRGEMQARQRQARSPTQAHSTHPHPIAPCNGIPVPNSPMPVPPCPIQAPLSPAVPQEIFNKDTAAEVNSLLREWRDWKEHARLQAHNTEALAELRQVLQQLLNIPKKPIVAEVLKRIRGRVDGNLDEVVVGVDEALRDLSRQLRDTRYRQEPAARSRAKRNFTNAREVDIALVVGLLFMSIVVVIIGNLDPVTQTY